VLLTTHLGQKAQVQKKRKPLGNLLERVRTATERKESYKYHTQAAGGRAPKKPEKELEESLEEIVNVTPQTRDHQNGRS